MNAQESTPSGVPSVDPQPGRGAIAASGWLGADGVYSHADDRRLGKAMTGSLAVHGVMIAAFLAVFAVAPEQILDRLDPVEYKVIFLPDPGPGGGGGGSPAPAPPKPVEIPKAKAPDPVPTPVPIPVEPPPIPTLVAPIQTANATVLQASGSSMVSLAAYGGGGRGGGVGSGTGNGVGPGTGGGFGGGAFQPGNGVTWPSSLREVQPTYTTEAMRAKIQGDVELEIVVLENGTVGDIRVTKSLDRAYGLDQAAIDAAKKWLFKPGVRQGIAVATRVNLIITFRLH